MVSDHSVTSSRKHKLNNFADSEKVVKMPRKALNSANSRSSTPFTSIESFLSQVVFLVFVQDDDDLALRTIQRDFAPNVKENANGTTLSRDTFTALVQQIRIDIFSRRLVTESFLIVPDEKVSGSAVVGHTVKLSGVRNGKEVVVNALVVVDVDIIDGVRQISMENIVFKIEEDEDSS